MSRIDILPTRNMISSIPCALFIWLLGPSGHMDIAKRSALEILVRESSLLVFAPTEQKARSIRVATTSVQELICGQ